MQLPPERVEVTILRSRNDLRRTTRAVYASQASRVARLGGSVAVTIGIIALCVELPIAGGACFLGAVAAVTYGWWGPELAVRRLPAWAFRPVTFRLSAEGIEVETEASRRVLEWEAVKAVDVTSDAYFFASPGRRGVILHRRGLTEQDSAAIVSMIERYGKTASRSSATSE